MFIKLKQLDEYLTDKIAICSNKNNNNSFFNYLRYILILLEFSFHGLPWFIIVIYLLATNQTYTPILKPILIGMCPRKT